MKTPESQSSSQTTVMIILVGLLFFGINATASYAFSLNNFYKILLVLITVLALWLYYFLKPDQKVLEIKLWKVVGVLFLPTLAVLPGCLKGAGNYDFALEFSTNIIVILWALFFYLAIKSFEDIKVFIFFVGLTIIYISLWAFLEKTGYHPFPSTGFIEGRVRSTFGHPNQLSCFLVLLLPLFLTLSYRSHHPPVIKIKNNSYLIGQNFFLIVLIAGTTTLLLAQTRAAIAAFILSMLFTVFLLCRYLQFNLMERIQVRQIKYFTAVVFIGAFFLLYFYQDNIMSSRIGVLFSIEGWYPRFISWQPAIDSFKASPLVGFGLGSYYNQFFNFVSPEMRLFFDQRSSRHAHSEILEYLQEGGLLGFTTYLGFWGYIAYRLFKVIKSDSVNQHGKRLAIGIFGGLFAYTLHSFFTIAPRAMVVKLPLFSLLTLTFLLNDSKLTGLSPNLLLSKSVRPILGIGLLVLIAFASALYYPILINKYKSEPIYRNSNIIEKTDQLEKLVMSNPDIFALDQLSRFQLILERKEKLKKTLLLIDNDFKNYRVIGYTKAALAFLENDFDRSKALALEYQKRDMFYQLNIELLMSLAVRTDDYSLFSKELKMLTKKIAFNHRLVITMDAQKVMVTIDTIDPAWEIISDRNSLKIVLNEKMAKALFHEAKSSAKNPLTKTRFIKVLEENLGYEPFFNLEIKSNVGVDKKEKIYATVDSFYKIKIDISNLGKDLIALKNFSQKAAVQEKLKEKEKEITMLRQYLERKTDWDGFVKKRKFLADFKAQIEKLLYSKNPVPHLVKTTTPKEKI